MGSKLFNRAKMTVSGTPGTGTITLLAAVTAYQSFAASGVANLDLVHYLIEDGNNWEYGIGTYTTAGTTLARTTVLGSTSAGAAISATSAAIVSISAFAEDFRGKWHEWVSADYMRPRLTNGCTAGLTETSGQKNVISTLDFVNSGGVEHAQFSYGFPPSYNGGTVSFIPVWSHAATTTNFGVSWKLGGRVFTNDDAYDQAMGTVQESADTGGTTNDIYVGPESAAITLAGVPAGGKLAQFDLQRDHAAVGDNMAINARLHGIWLIFSTNTATDDP